MLLNRTEFGNPAHLGRLLSKEEAHALLNDWVKNPRLLLHMHQVGHLMRCWAAEREGLDEVGQWKWEMAGLLHDADWDQWPDTHCRKIVEYLEEKQVDGHCQPRACPFWGGTRNPHRQNALRL
jgi:predicted hydrolase (HD superfamily)